MLLPVHLLASLVLALPCLAPPALSQALLPAIRPASTRSLELDEAAALADLAHLLVLLRTRHADLDWLAPEAEFDAIATKAVRAIETATSPESRAVALLTVVAAVRDGHTAVDGASRTRLFGELPLRFDWVGPSLRVVHAAEEGEPALGCRVLAVDGVPVAEIARRLRAVVPCSNEPGFRRFSPRYLHLPGLLHGLGVARSPSAVTLTVIGAGGAVRDIVLRRRDGPGADELRFRDALHSANVSAPSTPLLRRRAGRPFFMERSDALLYVRLRAVRDAPDERLMDFSDRVLDALDADRPDRIVVDLRGNGGGNGMLTLELAAGLAARRGPCAEGRVILLTDRWTFSAAILLANQLQMKAGARIVGTPAGARPNTPGDADTYSLPRTAIDVAVSRYLHSTTYPLDARETLAPDHRVERTWADLREGRDPVLEAALELPLFSPSPATPGGETPDLPTERYVFAPDRDLVLRTTGAGAELEITGRVRAPLRATSGGRLRALGPGLVVRRAATGALEVSYPDGRVRSLPRATPQRITPLDALLRGDHALAAELYGQVQALHPELPGLRDNNLAIEAVCLYFATGDVEATRALLRIAIALNPGADFAARSLSYF